jgi:hypothetical protein
MEQEKPKTGQGIPVFYTCTLTIGDAARIAGITTQAMRLRVQAAKVPPGGDVSELLFRVEKPGRKAKKFPFDGVQLTIAEIAERIGTTQQTVYKHAKAGTLHLLDYRQARKVLGGEQ